MLRNLKGFKWKGHDKMFFFLNLLCWCFIFTTKSSQFLTQNFLYFDIKIPLLTNFHTLKTPWRSRLNKQFFFTHFFGCFFIIHKCFYDFTWVTASRKREKYFKFRCHGDFHRRIFHWKPENFWKRGSVCRRRRKMRQNDSTFFFIANMHCFMFLFPWKIILLHPALDPAE